MFNQIEVYEVRADHKEEFEAIMKDEAVFYNAQNGVITIKVIKNNYYLEEISSENPEGIPKRADEVTDNVTYIVYCTYENEATFTNVYKTIRDKYFKKISKLIIGEPKVMLGGNVV